MSCTEAIMRHLTKDKKQLQFELWGTSQTAKRQQIRVWLVARSLEKQCVLQTPPCLGATNQRRMMKMSCKTSTIHLKSVCFVNTVSKYDVYYYQSCVLSVIVCNESLSYIVFSCNLTVVLNEIL